MKRKTQENGMHKKVSLTVSKRIFTHVLTSLTEPNVILLLHF